MGPRTVAVASKVSFHWLEKTLTQQLPSLPMCGFIAQLVEQHTGNAEVMGSNPVEALILENWKIHCDDHSLLSQHCLSLFPLFYG